MRSIRNENFKAGLTTEHGKALLATGILLSITGALMVELSNLSVPVAISLTGAILVRAGIRRL